MNANNGPHIEHKIGKTLLFQFVMCSNASRNSKWVKIIIINAWAPISIRNIQIEAQKLPFDANERPSIEHKTDQFFFLFFFDFVLLTYEN